MTTIGKFARMYQPKETVNYEAWIKSCFQQQRGSFTMIPQGVAVEVEIWAYYNWPKSMSARKRLTHLYKVSKPDSDNIIKCLDSLNGIAWHDDCQIARVSLQKLYCHHEPYMMITIKEI